jgi:hypothetical protein
VTMESVKNEMRNKTSAMGGNFLVIDEIKSVSSSTRRQITHRSDSPFGRHAFYALFGVVEVALE